MPEKSCTNCAYFLEGVDGGHVCNALHPITDIPKDQLNADCFCNETDWEPREQPNYEQLEQNIACYWNVSFDLASSSGDRVIFSEREVVEMSQEQLNSYLSRPGPVYIYLTVLPSRGNGEAERRDRA